MKTITIKTMAGLNRYTDLDGTVHVPGNLVAECSIDVRGYLSVDGSIEAGSSIEARGYIEAGRYIKAGGYDIAATSISTKTLPYWRKYYADMPPLKKWRDKILDNNNCWHDLKLLPTKAEAKKICAWDGWHWIIRGQLECFFGLRESFSPPQEGKE